MTVKKTLSLKRPTVATKVSAPDGGAEPSAAHAAAAPSGGATIADRFKLDTPPAEKPTAAGTGAKIAVAAAVMALVVAGILAYTIYGHWEFLKGA